MDVNESKKKERAKDFARLEKHLESLGCRKEVRVVDGVAQECWIGIRLLTNEEKKFREKTVANRFDDDLTTV